MQAFYITNILENKTSSYQSLSQEKKPAWRVELARAERLLLAIAVATPWVLSVGGEADATVPVSSKAVGVTRRAVNRRWAR